MLLKSMVMRRMRIIIAIAHTKDCEKSKTAPKAIIRLITGLSTFSGRGFVFRLRVVSMAATLTVVGG